MPHTMQRALKERIVGAAILVVVAVLVVPVFLDGSAGDADVVTESVTLPGQNEQPRKRQTIVLDRDRTEPVPTGGGVDEVQAEVPAAEVPADAAAAPDTGPAEIAAAAPQQAAPASAPPRDAPAAAERSATGMWAVQLGSFSKPENAERLAADLRSKGYAAFLSQLDGSNGPLHRVRIGPQKDRASAEEVAARLAADGHKGQVLPHP